MACALRGGVLPGGTGGARPPAAPRLQGGLRRLAHLIWPVWAPGHTRVACLEEGGGMDGAALPRGGGLPEVREAWDGSGALSLFSSVTDRPWA